MARAGGPRAVRRNLNVYSRREFDAIDGRLLEAREERRIVRALNDHVGQPSVPEQMLIRRTARVLIMLGVLERRILEGHDLGDLQARQTIALGNSIRLNLVAFGLKRSEREAFDPISYLEANRKAAA
jgi:hypothetical protein